MSQSSVYARTTLSDRQIAWLHQVVNEGQLIADLAFADIVVWAATPAGSFVAMSHLRPSSAVTLFYRDLVESPIRPEWLPIVLEAYQKGIIIDLPGSEHHDDGRTRVRAVPIRAFGDNSSKSGQVIAVLTRHSNMSEPRIPSRQELTFDECANDLFSMIAEGSFPNQDSPGSPTRGAPRASDGLIRLDVGARVSFASPNALSAFRRMGFQQELEGAALAEVTASLISGTLSVDEALPLVVTGRAPWRSDIENAGVTITLRAIPVSRGGTRTGAIVLCRDITQLRLHEKELITKDATIREIHHRVKNNLQTVASLLRIQARRTTNDLAKDALSQAMRRVAAIAVVHDTLSEGLSQTVDFDIVLRRVLALVAEVAAGTNPVVTPKSRGSFGILPSEYATPLSLVLTELVTNAVEHGLKGRHGGEVVVESFRSDNALTVSVRDNGEGVWIGDAREGLGTQIVRTLVEGELGGVIRWLPVDRGGTEVLVTVPTRFLHEKGLPLNVSSV